MDLGAIHNLKCIFEVQSRLYSESRQTKGFNVNLFNEKNRFLEWIKLDKSCLNGFKTAFKLLKRIFEMLPPPTEPQLLGTERAEISQLHLKNFLSQ